MSIKISLLYKAKFRLSIIQRSLCKRNKYLRTTYICKKPKKTSNKSRRCTQANTKLR